MSDAALFGSVVLLEDDEGHAHLIQRALRGLVGEVRHASSLSKALELIAVSPAEVIITDLHVPDHSGPTIVRELRAKSDAPIIVLTSSSSLNDAVAAMQAGARDYIVKDFEANFRDVVGLSLSRVFAALSLEAEKARLQREMQALMAAVEMSRDGLAVVDTHGHVTYANAAFCAFAERCGGKPTELLQAITPKIVKHENLLQDVRSFLSQVESGSTWSTELGFVDDKQQAFDLSLTVVREERNEAGALVARTCVAWIRDVSERKRREKFQREVLSTTTHDLKGPLGAICLCVEMLEEAVKGQDKASQLVLRIGSSARGALNLIDEFLSARRIQEGAMVLKPVELDVQELVEGVVADFHAMAASRQIELTFQNLGTQRLARVDKLGLGRVVGNLVSNAIKYTPKSGRATVRMEIGYGELRIWVEDSGSGMEPAQVQSLFERYTRLKQHQGIEGTGLGLFVVKSIVTACGGRIEVRSKVGEGSCFSVILPLEPPVNERGEIVSLSLG